MVTSVSSSSAIGSIFQASQSSAEQANSVFGKSADMYLQLFLTQLRNQDPTQPMEVADMANQLSQLNSSQQLIGVNKNLETLISATNNNQASSLANFINKDVEYLGDTFYIEEGGNQKFSYFVDGEYTDINIEVRDENDQLVIKLPADKTTGTHDFTWDGKNTLGDAVTSGTYKIAAVAKDSDGKFTSLSTFLSGKVTGVDFASAAEPIVFIGTDKNRVGVDLSRISAILGNSSTTTTTTTNNG